MDNISIAKKMLRLDLSSGRFFWAKAPRCHIEVLGNEAGFAQRSKNKSYWVIKLNGKAIKRGRLVFAFLNGRMPMPCIDHINGDSLDDRPENLREATVTQNSWNHKTRKKTNTHLPMGVKVSASGRFVARISCNKKHITIGSFDTAEAASLAYKQQRLNLFGEFHGL